MITCWYVGFVGDIPGKPRNWFDIFTCKSFRHVLALAYDPVCKTWLHYEPTVTGTKIALYTRDSKEVSALISAVTEYGVWLKIEGQTGSYKTGCWRLYCVPAIKHLVGLKSSALTPKGLFRDLLKAGAKPIFEKEK